MPDESVKVEGFKASIIFESLDTAFKAFEDEEKTAFVQRINGVFEITIINATGKIGTWTLYMKNNSKDPSKVCTIALGKAEPKADVTLQMSDDVFLDIEQGKLNGQKAFMTQKLKVKGNVMLALKLDAVLKGASSTLKSKL